MTHEEKMKLLIDEKYPLSAKYDLEWIYENKMGCQCLWLVESLSQIMTLKPGMRILDMGCGNALTSIFLAKEFGVTVFANDLWVSPTDNWKRICNAGVENLVFQFMEKLIIYHMQIISLMPLYVLILFSFMEQQTII